MTNAFGRGLIKLSDEGTFKAVKKLYVKKGADWRDAKTAWIKQNGSWIQVYPTPRGQITFDPPTLDFEATNGYESPTQFVSITNTGDENVIIEDFSVSYTAAGKFVTFFDLSELGGQVPATIAPGETKRLGIAIDAGSGSAYVQQEVVVMVDTPTLKKVNILCPLTSIDVDYLVVAGGGGGGAGIAGASYSPGSGFAGTVRAGGGGAGGVVVGYKRSVKRGETVQIKVGQGGAGGNASNGRVPGADGGNSSFGDIVTIGGGGGVATSGVAGRPGGSGGGSARAIFGTNYGASGGAGTPGQGYPGGSSNNIRVSSLGYSGADEGGGGGAGGPGSISGGPGRVSTITGTRQYYGGGGGGTSGGGGAGGGGAGGTSATANTGGGGGGGLIPYSYGKVTRPNGGDGGSGIVVIKYEYDVQLGQGGTVTTYTTDAGVKNWVHTFTQDGAFSYNEVLETRTITVTEQVATTTQQLGLSNAGELGSSDATIRIKTNVGAFGTQYTDYTIYGNVVPPYAEIDIFPGRNVNFNYFRYNPRQNRQEVRITNIGTGSIIFTEVSVFGQYFNIVSYPDAIAPREYGIIVIESRVDDNTPLGIYTDTLTIKSNNVNGDLSLILTLDVMFPAGDTRITTAGAGKWVVPEGVYRLSEVRVIGSGGGGGQGFNQQFIPGISNPNDKIVISYSITGNGAIRTTRGSVNASSGSLTVYEGELVSIIVASGVSSRVEITYESAKRVGSGGTVTSYTIDALTYWVHTFTSSRSFSYVGLDPVLFGGIGRSRARSIPGAGSGGGGGSGSITLVANLDVMPGETIEYYVGAGGAGVDPILSTTNPAPAGKPGQTTSFKNGLVAAAGGLGGGGGGPNTGGVGAGNTPNPRVTGAGLVPRTLSYAWSGHMNTYAVWDNPSDAANAWYTFRKFVPTATDNYSFYLSCDNYGVLYLNGPAILSTTSFQSVSGTTVSIQKDTVNIIGMYAQNWGGPCGYALHVTDSAGNVVWDTRTYKAAETIESLPGAVTRQGGVGQNGTAGVGDGGHGGSNTLGLGGVPGLYDAPPPAGSVYFANQAALVSGNNSNLVVPGNFTVECWIKQTGRPNTWNGVFEIGQWPNPTILLRCFGVDLDFYWGPGTGQIYPYVNINQWHHIAVSRSGTLTRVYVDGIARLTVTIGGTLNPSGLPITIGGNTVALGRTGFTGYISNFRFVNGTALYTDNFTPPTQVLTAVPGTVILACQTNDTTLNSTGLVPLSKYGNPTNSDEMPFFVPNKPVTLSAGGRGRGPGTGGGGGASGVDGQFTPASGAGADGEIYIAWGPIVPRDPPPNLIAHFVIDINEQRFYDRILPYCNPYSMVTSGFFTERGRNYVSFNGTANNYIGTPADAKYDLVRVANASFTIEAWVILKGAGQYPYYGGIIVNRDAEYEVAISQSDQVIVAIDWGVGTDVNLPGSGWIIPPAGVAVIPRNVPTHVAVVANQNTLLIYINGTLSYTTPLNRVARRDNTPVWIGNRPGQSQGFNGGIADVRIWNVARTQAQIQTNIAALVYNTPQGI
jgi:hypothetical protein